MESVFFKSIKSSIKLNQPDVKPMEPSLALTIKPKKLFKITDNK